MDRRDRFKFPSYNTKKRGSRGGFIVVVNLKNFSGKWKDPPLPHYPVKANYIPIDSALRFRNISRRSDHAEMQ
jgi:hypothetical protein